MIGIVALTTFLVFFIEGLVHYNIGKNKLTKFSFHRVGRSSSGSEPFCSSVC